MTVSIGEIHLGDQEDIFHKFERKHRELITEMIDEKMKPVHETLSRLEAQILLLTQSQPSKKRIGGAKEPEKKKQSTSDQ